MTQYTRQNAWDANNGGQFTNTDGSYTNLYWYAKAVAVMKAKPISDPTSWWFYAAIHGQYITDYFGTGAAPTNYPNWTKINSIPAVANLSTLPTQAQMDLFWNQCQHGSWFFTPWHRGYLVALENILRDIIVGLNGPADWALPYWNYLNQSTQYNEAYLPPAFAATTLPDGTPNALYCPERYGPYGDATNVFLMVGPSMTANINDLCQWDTVFNDSTTPSPVGVGNNFGFYYGGQKTPFSHNGSGYGDIEMNPHNFTHSMVGGLQGQEWSLEGPITFAVDSTKPWQATGVNIRPGTTVWVAYDSGTWTADPQDPCGRQYDANGSPDIIVPADQTMYPIVNVPMGVLIGRVNGGTPFVIGDGSVVADNVSGPLELCINDDLTGAYGAGLKDNAGVITVYLTEVPAEEYEGLMADPGLAGLDPIFFLHHANIDRMWTAWIVTGGNSDPTDPSWLAGPSAFGNSQFAMPMDDQGTPWYYTPQDMINTTNLKYYGGATYAYTYDDLTLASYSTKPAAPKSNQRMIKLGAAPNVKAANMSGTISSALVGASGTGVKLGSGMTQTAVKLDGSGWKALAGSLEKATTGAQPDEVILKLENVTGTANSNFLSVFVNNKLAGSVSLFGIRMASMKNGAHGGAGLTFQFNITDIVDGMYLDKNIAIESLNVQIRTKNPLPKGSELSVGRISVYRSEQ